MPSHCSYFLDCHQKCHFSFCLNQFSSKVHKLTLVDMTLNSLLIYNSSCPLLLTPFICWSIWVICFAGKPHIWDLHPVVSPVTMFLYPLFFQVSLTRFSFSLRGQEFFMNGIVMGLLPVGQRRLSYFWWYLDWSVDVGVVSLSIIKFSINPSPNGFSIHWGSLSRFKMVIS